MLVNEIKNLSIVSIKKKELKVFEESKNNIIKNELNEMNILNFQNKNDLISAHKKNKIDLSKRTKLSSKSLKSKDLMINDDPQIDNKIKINNNNNDIHNNIDNNNNIKNNHMEKYSEKTDREMNYLSYERALKSDQRTFFQCYLSLIKTKQIFIFTFLHYNDFNSPIIKICYFFFLFALFLTINILFVEDSSFHILHISKGSIDLIYHLHKIIYSTLICFILPKILEPLIFTEMNIIKARKGEGKEKSKKLRNIHVKICIKSILFFTLSLLFLFVFWIYISCFCAVFKNSQLYIIIMTSISFGLFNALPFVLSFIPPIFRLIALIDREESTKSLYFYKLSRVLQIIL